MTLPSVLQSAKYISKTEIIYYEPTDVTTTGSHAVQREQIFTVCAPSSATVVWPGEYLELDIPPDLRDDRILALQPHRHPYL